MANPSPLRWIFELYDKMSAPAKQIEKSVEGVNQVLGKTSESMVSFAGKFALIEEGVHASVEVLEQLGEKLKDIGVDFVKDAIGAANFEQQSEIAFRALLGSGEAAEKAMNSAKNFALAAGLPIRAVMQDYKNLVLGGIKPINVPLVLQAATDVAAIQGSGAAGASSIAQTFADIQSRGQLTGRAMMAFKGIIDFDVLATKLGHAGMGFSELRKQMEKTPASAEKGISAILDALAAKQGGVLGKTTMEMGQTLPGIIQRIKDRWDVLLASFGDSGAFKGIVKAAKALDDALDPTSKTGGQLVRIFERVSDAIGKIDFVGMTESLIAFVQGGDIKTLAADVGALGSAFSFVARAVYTIGYGWSQIVALLGLFEDLGAAVRYNVKGAFYELVEIGRTLWQSFKTIGGDMLHGLVEGIEGGVLMAVDAVGNLAKGVVDKMRSALGISSPSKVMMELGVNTAEGYQQGLDRGGLKESIVLPLAPPPRGEDRTAPEAPARGGTPKLEVVQNFTIHAAPGMDVEALAERIATISAGELQSPFDHFAMQMGAA